MNLAVKFGVVVVSLAAMVLALAACGPRAPDQLAKPEPTNPFHSRVVLGEGFIYEIEGFTHGHHPEYSSEFQVTFINPTQNVWPVEYCLLMLDRDGVVTTLLTGGFEVAPDSQREESLAGMWAGKLAPAPYGLALVLPQRSSQVNTIWVGDEPGPARVPGAPPDSPVVAGPWPVVAACP
jgi:hypothetical protein